MGSNFTIMLVIWGAFLIAIVAYYRTARFRVTEDEEESQSREIEKKRQENIKKE